MMPDYDILAEAETVAARRARHLRRATFVKFDEPAHCPRGGHQLWAGNRVVRVLAAGQVRTIDFMCLEVGDVIQPAPFLPGDPL